MNNYNRKTCCYKCDERHTGCHSTCTDYEELQTTKSKINAARHKATDLMQNRNKSQFQRRGMV